MRLVLTTVCCSALAAGVARADVAALPSERQPPRPTTTLATTVRVFPASAVTSHPARVQVKVPRATLQALLQRAHHDGTAMDAVLLGEVTPDAPAGPDWPRTVRTVVAATALALAVLLLPLLRRRRRSAALALAMAGLVLTVAWTARADIAAPRLQAPAGPPARPTPARGTTQPTPATLELIVTDDGSTGILLTHATPR